AQLCAELALPHVASLPAIPQSAASPLRPPDALPHCDIAHCDSLSTAAQWRHWLGAPTYCARESVSQDSFDQGLARELEQLDAAPARPDHPLRVLVPGPLREDRGQLHAIAALAALHRDGVAATLLLAGDPAPAPEYAHRCRQRITAAALDEHVQWLAPDALLAELPRADLLLSPAAAGDLPLALKEAMALGVLVVATPVGGVPELIVDGVSGLLASDTS